MKRLSIYIPYRQMTERLGPMVRERILHITCTRNLRSIISDGRVSGNANGSLPSSFGSSRNGFFRRRNAISVFDYRGLSDEAFYDAWCKCGPLTALPKCGYKIAALFLAENVYSQLISWRLWHKEQAYEQMVVPQVEFGYPAPLPLTAIEEILEVRTRYIPSALERILAASRK